MQFRKDRIEARLTALGIDQFTAAERTGKGSHFIYDFMIGRKKSFKGDGPTKVAEALECSLEYLTGASGVPGDPPAAAQLGKSLLIVGTVEAGVFKSPREAKPPHERSNIPPIPGHPAEDQVVFKVVGGGLDARGIVSGMVLVASRSSARAETFKDGEIIVVEHTARDGRGVEISAREVQHSPNRVELRAPSKSEEIAPIVLKPEKSSGKSASTKTASGGSVRVIAVAIFVAMMLA
jgi:hypothetical protein